MHAKAFEHLSRSSESDRSTLLLDGKRCKEDRHEAVLAERNSEFRMPGDLKCELAISPFVEQLLFRQSPDWQPAQHERSRAETEVLILLFTANTDKLNAANPLELLSRDDEFRLLLAQELAGRCQRPVRPRSEGRRQ
jgi:hypothetical protein